MRLARRPLLLVSRCWSVLRPPVYGMIPLLLVLLVRVFPAQRVSHVLVVCSLSAKYANASRRPIVGRSGSSGRRPIRIARRHHRNGTVVAAVRVRQRRASAVALPPLRMIAETLALLSAGSASHTDSFLGMSAQPVHKPDPDDPVDRGGSVRPGVRRATGGGAGGGPVRQSEGVGSD